MKKIEDKKIVNVREEIVVEDLTPNPKVNILQPLEDAIQYKITLIHTSGWRGAPGDYDPIKVKAKLNELIEKYNGDKEKAQIELDEIMNRTTHNSEQKTLRKKIHFTHKGHSNLINEKKLAEYYRMIPVRDQYIDKSKRTHQLRYKIPPIEVYRFSVKGVQYITKQVEVNR